MADDSEQDGGTPGDSTADPAFDSLLRRAAAVDPNECEVPPPRPGVVLDGKYRLVARIGAGGMGAVYSAIHVITEKPVAVKWLRRSIADEHNRRRFLREARAAGRVRHPNVVDIYDVGEVGSSGYLVMELLQGESLRARMVRGRMPHSVAIDLLLPAMRGVAAMHAAGVLHRDLKPDNIFLCLDANGELRETKVLDFGLSTLTHFSPTDTTLTQEGTFAGTPGYAAPERLQQSELAADERADVYSLGVIAYELLTGRLPIEANSYPGLILAVANQRPKRPSSLCPELPHALDAIVLRALAKHREQRFASVEQLSAALAAFASVPGAAPARPPRGRRVRLTLGSGLLAALSLGLALWAREGDAPSFKLGASVQQVPIENVYDSRPATADVAVVDCDRCAAVRCSGQVQACNADERCTALAAAARAGAPPITDREYLRQLADARWEFDHGRAPWTGLRNDLVGCVRRECQTTCAVGRKFDCVGHFDWPSSYPRAAELKLRLLPDDPQQTMSGWSVRACAPGAGCDRLMAQSETDEQGFAVLALDLTNIGPTTLPLPEYDGRLELHGNERFFPQIIQQSMPFLDGWYVRYALSSRAEIKESHLPRRLPIPGGGLGLLQIQLQDCDYRVAWGLRLEVWRYERSGLVRCDDCQISYADSVGIPDPTRHEFSDDNLFPAEFARAPGELLLVARDTVSGNVVSILPRVYVRAGWETSVMMFPASRAQLAAAPREVHR